MTTETQHEPGNEDEGTEELHDESVAAEPVRDAVLRGENGRLLRGSPKMFYDKLRKRLNSLGVDLDQLDNKTSPDDPPPCFQYAGSDYKEWMRLAAVEIVPPRYDMPGEPNYCFDCTPKFKSEAMKCGACLFPNTRFEVRKTEGEKETIGISRSRELPPDTYVVYQHMTVPLEALHAKLKRFVKRTGMGVKKDWLRSDFPPDVQEEYEQLNVTRRKVVSW